MLRKRSFWIVLLFVAALVGGGGYYYYTTTAPVTAATTEPEVQTAVARIGEITVSATGAGRIIAAQEIDLAFVSSGTLTQLNVQVGDQVTTGDALAQIDDSDAQQALVAAQLQLSQAAMQTDATATQTGVSYDDISIEQASINRDTAQAALDELLNWQADEDEIAQLEASLAAAEASYNAARGQEAASGANISIQQISVAQAERDLAEAQAAYDTAWDPGRDWELNVWRGGDALAQERERTAAALLRAQESLQIAQLNYNATVSGTNHSSSTNAEGSLLAAQIALDEALNGPTEAEIEAAEIALRQAELTLQQARLNQEAHALSLAAAQLSVVTAQAAVENMTLVAPIDGTVTAVNYDIGETVSGIMLTLANLSQPMLEVYLDEADLNMVGLGYQVTVTFDALPDDTFTGSVVQIDPQLVNESNVTAVRAIVQLDTVGGAAPFAKPQTLPIGLSATVEVIAGQTQNAVLIPVEALREIATDQYTVFVMSDSGELELRSVTVGLMDFTYAEILSGLEAGEVVTTGIVVTE